jgi:hypothetical protein
MVKSNKRINPENVPTEYWTMKFDNKTKIRNMPKVKWDENEDDIKVLHTFKGSNHHSYYASEAKRGLFDIIKIVKSSNQRRLSKEFDFLIILWLLPFWGFLRWHWAKAQPLLRPRPFPEKLK